MKKAIDSLQVDIPPPRCGPLLTRAALQILVNSAEPHARSIAAADLAAGNFCIHVVPFSSHICIHSTAVSCEYQFAEWLLSADAGGALLDVFSLLSTCEGEVLQLVCHAGDATQLRAPRSLCS